ncbi:hypothetical protein [Burkholderia sp. PU8-34]
MSNSSATSLASETLARKLDEYRHPYWLKSEFGASQLFGDFGKAGTITLDFDREISPGFHLMHEAHRDFLEDIYLWLGLQTHRDSNNRNSRGGSEKSDKLAIQHTLTIIDYLLLRSNELKLHEFGLSALSKRQLRQFLYTISEDSETYNSVYMWRASLDKFIESSSEHLRESEYMASLKAFPEIAQIDDAQRETVGSFTDEQIIRTRAFLHTHGMCHRSSTVEYAWIPDINALRTLLYSGTLRGADGHNRWPVPRELCWCPHERYVRECENASIGADEVDAIPSEKNFEIYRRHLLTLEQLAKCGRGPSVTSVREVAKLNYRDVLTLKPPGRTFTLPPDYVMSCIGKGIDFFFENGEHILESYFNVIKAAKDSNTSVRKFTHAHDIQQFCRPETIALGVRQFSLKGEIGRKSHRKNNKLPEPRASKEEYFSRFRACEGLVELVQALFGAIAFVIGTLMAARDAELETLRVDNCLSETRRWLNLLTRKSGTPFIQRPDSRPLPKVCQIMVTCLQQFNSRCKSAGIATSELLFSMPGRGSKSSDGHSVLDLFVDFIDSPKLPDGSRYYVRQHMLRRFFAIVFFCSAGLEGLESLRWMMRHLDMEHLYYYITASIPGGILRSIKSAAAAKMVRAGSVEYIDLAKYLRVRFGTSRFDVLSEYELASHIESLQRDGTVRIEPIFLDEHGRRDFRIGVQIWDSEVEFA